MKKITFALALIVIIILAFIIFGSKQSHAPSLANNIKSYISNKYGFSIGYPSDFIIDENHIYQALGPNKTINGVKFTIPTSVATGTNLSEDSYISVEEIPGISVCNASSFTLNDTKASTFTDAGVTYSFAKTSDAAAGNRYDETIYALSGSNPCIAVRYFIHYGVFQNYPEGSIKEFDENALTSQFDTIRRTLKIN